LGEEIALENGRISDFQGLVTLTLTLDQIILHTVMHHSLTSIYTPNFIEIEETFCGRTDGRTYRRTFETHFIRSTWRSRPKNATTTIASQISPLNKVQMVKSAPPTLAETSVNHRRMHFSYTVDCLRSHVNRSRKTHPLVVCQ